MRAVVITRPGGPDVLTLAEVPQRSPGPGEITVAVRAAGVNRADLLQRRGIYPAPPGAPADIPGLEVAGVVEALGPGASRWAAGDRVMAVVGGGGYAERVVLHEDEALPIPPHLGFEEAAAVPEAFMTAWDALFAQARVSAGEWVLVHAAASGVGTAAVQLLHAAGARVLGTSRTADKLARVMALGLDHPILVGSDGGAPAFRDAVHAATGGHGADVVLDLVGGPYTAESVHALAPRGRLMLVGLMSGAQTALPLDKILMKRLTLRGTVLRSRSLDEKIEAARGFTGAVSPLLDRGEVRPVLSLVLPMREAAAAHQALEGNTTFGKVVLRW